MTFKITKKGSNNFWHTYNNNSKVVNLSDFDVVLDYASQTFSISMRNGANVPNISVGIVDIIVVDETGANVNETFANVEELRLRLVALNYTPYIISGGGSGVQSVVAGTNVTVDNTDPLNPIVSATGGGGGSQTLAETLVLGNETDGEDILVSDGDGVFMDNGSRLIKGVTDAGTGGAKGIALKCSIDYEYKWEAGSVYVLEQDGFTVRETKYNFAITPTATDDSTKGFVVGSRWILDNGDLYICKDATSAAAVWELQIISGGGNGSFVYYLNGSVSQATIGGNDYKEMNSVPVIGTGTDFSISANGYIAQFLTDVADPNRLIIPAGNWNFETYFSANSNGGSPRFYIELYKYDGATLTLLASNSATPEYITGGTSIDLYFSALAVPYTVLLATDRLAVRFYVINSSKTITMHTENSHLSEVITTFPTGVDSVNGQTGVVVLDTADISEATDKNYVSDAELVVIGNTSGTNTGDQDLSTLQPYAVATFVAEITFDVPKIFFNFAAPTTAALTSNLTGAKKGVVQKIYVNHATNPVSSLSGWVLIGSGTYTPSVANIIFAEWTDGARVEYWIVKA
jgi:hypothetical protein